MLWPAPGGPRRHADTGTHARRQRPRGRHAVVRRLEMDAASEGSGRASSPGAGPASLASAVPASLMAVALGAGQAGLSWGAALVPDRLPPADKLASVRCAAAPPDAPGVLCCRVSPSCKPLHA